MKKIKLKSMGQLLSRDEVRLIYGGSGGGGSYSGGSSGNYTSGIPVTASGSSNLQRCYFNYQCSSGYCRLTYPGSGIVHGGYCC